jgi:hypothetical protein
VLETSWRLGTVTLDVGIYVAIIWCKSHFYALNVQILDLLIHHTNYGTDKTSSEGQGQLSESTEEDTSFITSPLNQTLVFNDSDKSNNQLTAHQIIEMKPAKGSASQFDCVCKWPIRQIRRRFQVAEKYRHG